MGVSPSRFRLVAWVFAAVALVQAGLLPFTAHLYDVSTFLETTNRIFFAHTPLSKDWAFGSVSLIALLVSQAVILFNPLFANAIALRICLLKLPYLISDIGTAVIIRFIAVDRSLADEWALRYLADPAVFFVTVFHGQQDALPSVFAVLGIALMVSGRYELSALALGVGTGTKFFPAAYLPLLCVAALQRAGWGSVFRSLAVFAASSGVTLLPFFWGRTGSVVGEYSSNSFGQSGTHVSSSSLWALLPAGFHVGPQIEQFVAVLLPLGLAACELRHRPDAKDVARAAMVTAMSIVLLNPGAHPPFALWIAGPLVLYCAVTGDGFVSLAGVALSASTVLLQFCQEGVGEYYLLRFGAGPTHSILTCFGGTMLLGVAFAACTVIIASSYGLFDAIVGKGSRRAVAIAATVLTVLVFVASCISVGLEIRSAALNRNREYSFAREEAVLNTVAVGPLGRTTPEACTHDYDGGDSVFFAGNRYAARFAKASLGYTLFSDQFVVLDGTRLRVAAMPSWYENIDLLTDRQEPMRVTREFDVTRLLTPFRRVERITGAPCNLIPNNPLLIYRFNMPAARRAVYERPLWQRFNIFYRGE